MAKPKPPATTVFSWLKNNLGPRCLAPLTSTDARALQAAVQIVDLYSASCLPQVAAAFATVVSVMQPHTRHLAYHAVAHVMDWSHREELWARAGLEPLQNKGVCAFSPEAQTTEIKL